MPDPADLINDIEDTYWQAACQRVNFVTPAAEARARAVFAAELPQALRRRPVDMDQATFDEIVLGRAMYLLREAKFGLL